MLDTGAAEVLLGEIVKHQIVFRYRGVLGEIPGSYGVSLPVVYLIWIGVVVILYWPCRWFAAVKQRRRDVWLSYL